MKKNGPAKWVVITAVTAIFGLCVFLASRLALDEKITSMLPADDPVIGAYRYVIEKFHALDSVYIDVGPEEGKEASEEAIVKTADALYAELENSAFFASIQYRFSSEKMVGLLELLDDGKPRLLEAGDYREIEKRIQPDEIKRKLENAKRTLIEPSGAFMKERIQSDPLGFSEIILRRLEGFAGESSGVGIVDGRIRSADGRHVLIIASPKFVAADTVNGGKLVRFLEEAREKAVAAVPGSGVAISFAGGHIATLDNSSTIKSDVSNTMLALTAGVIILGLLLFPRFSYIVLVFLPAAFGLAFAGAFAGLFKSELSAIAIGCGAILAGITVDYGIHILFRMGGSGEKDAESPRAAVRSVILPLSMGSCTTIAAFLCLTLSLLPGQRQMGIFAALSVFGAAIFAAFALRFFIPAPRKKTRQPLLPLADYAEQFLNWRKRHGRILFAAGLLLLAVCAFGVTRVRFEGDVEKLNHLSDAHRKQEDRIKSTWGGFSSTSAVVKGDSPEAALRANETLSEKLRLFSDEGAITSLSTVSTVLKSAKAQDENLARWKNFWSNEKKELLRNRIHAAAAKTGFAKTAFKTFLESLDADPGIITHEDFRNTGLAGLIDSMMSGGGNENLIMTTFKVADRSRLTEVLSTVRNNVHGSIVMDKRAFVDHTVILVRTEFSRLVFYACIAMFVCLYLFLKRLELVLAITLPIIISVFVTLGFLGLFSIPLNLFNILFIIFVFGVGVDFSIFLFGNALSEYRGYGSHGGSTFASVVTCALTSTCGFAVLSFASHPALFSIGITGLIGMISSLAASVLIVPAVSSKLFHNNGKYATPSLKTVAGAIWAFVYLGGLASVYNYFLRYFCMLVYFGDTGKRRRFARKYMHLAAVGLIKYFPYLDSKVVYIGAAPEKFGKPAVIISNHLSPFDIMVILSLPGNMVMLVKEWVWKAPFLGRIIKDAGYILTEPDRAQAVLEKAEASLADGVSVMVFPEGRRSPNGTMKRFRKGGFELAARTKADILPVFLSDTQACMAKETFWVGDVNSVTRVLPRVTPENFDYTRDPRELAKHVKKLMLEHEHGDWRIAQSGRAFRHNLLARYNYLGSWVESYVRWKIRLDPVVRNIDGLVPENGTVLDLGCGYGLLSNLLAHKSLGRDVLGVDFDAGKIRVAVKTALPRPSARFVNENILEWDYPESGCILMIDVLHYWSRENQSKIIKKASDALEPGGVLAFREICRSTSFSCFTSGITERLSLILGINLGDKITFLDRRFYVSEFERNGLSLMSEATACARGAGVMLVFKKEV
jgi:1-acyl-sn-glycerol-3-phosphate acyltransferase